MTRILSGQTLRLAMLMLTWMLGPWPSFATAMECTTTHHCLAHEQCVPTCTDDVEMAVFETVDLTCVSGSTSPRPIITPSSNNGPAILPKDPPTIDPPTDYQAAHEQRWRRTRQQRTQRQERRRDRRQQHVAEFARAA